MPNIKSAQKKVRKDTKRTKNNALYIKAIEKAIKLLTKLKGEEKDSKQISKAVSLIDRAAKRRAIHKNKASRLKSRVMKLGAKKK